MARRTRTGDERKLTVEIDPQLLLDFQIYAKKQRKTLRDLAESWMRETLDLAGTYSSPQYMPLVERLLAEGKHTRIEIAEIVCSKITGIRKDTLLQFLTDAKRLHHFTRRVVEGEPRRCLRFGEPWGSQADDHSDHRDIENEGQTGDPSSNQG